MDKLPTYSHNKNKGNIAADILKKNLDKFSTVNPIDESIDLGIDMRAQIIENEHPTPLFFNIQCKGKDSLPPACIEKDHFSIQINVTTINYWLQQNDLTLLFIVDNETEVCYWCNPITQLNDRIKDIQSQETVTIHVPFSEYIDTSTRTCPVSLKKDILLFMTNQISKINNTMNELKDNFYYNQTLDIESSIYLIKNIYAAAQSLISNYQEICNLLIENIRKQFSDAYNYALHLEHLDPYIVHRYCENDVRVEKGFSSSHKSLEDLKAESDALIKKFLHNPDSPDILDDLLHCDMDMEDLLVNMGAFLYEMACEDNPFGDNSKLYDEVYGKNWKYH